MPLENWLKPVLQRRRSRRRARTFASTLFSSARSSSVKVAMRTFLRCASGTSRFADRRYDFDALLAAPSRAAAPRFLERHQKSERRILELQMTKHVPMPPHVLLQKIENVTEGDDATRRNFFAGRKRAEGDEANDVTRRQDRRAGIEKIIDDAVLFAGRVAESRDDRAQHFAIANAGVDADASFLHLADDHVDALRHDAEAWVEIAGVESAWRTATAARRQSGRKTERQNIDVGNHLRAVATGAREDRIFRGGEVAIELAVVLAGSAGGFHRPDAALRGLGQ